MTTPAIILQLVERFEEHRETYRAGKYNETQLRREFLDPFLKARGLATVQRIVARHGGKIWAEGLKGQSATVYFTLGE